MLARSLVTAAVLLAVVSNLTAADAAESTRPDPTATEAARPAPRKTRVLYITAKDCEQCAQELAKLRKPGGEFEAMQARGWKIGEGPENHIQIVDREATPELVLQLHVREYPTVACISNGEIVRSFKDGCSTPLDAWTFGWLIKGESERPQAVIPEAIRVTSTGSYRLRGNHWSVEGDWNPSREKVVAHLRGTHGGSVSTTYAIDGWSYEELRSLHDDIHEREGGSVTASGYYSGSGYYQAPQPRGADQFGAGRKMMGL
ncbi:MAG TPA: hypothetical protein VGH74_12140 [Planctomycetaceae bacterium]|jgi:hypothetical protein